MTDLSFTWVRRGENAGGLPPLLSLRSLYVKVGIRMVLTDVNIALFEGDVVYVTGPNGTGKSSLLNAIAGLEPARIMSGKVLLAGEDVTDMPAHRRAECGVAYLRQRDNVFPDLTVGENLQLALGRNGYSLFRSNYSDWATNLPEGKRVNLLSGGERQRLAWAMSTMRPRHLLLADEPEAGLSTRLQLPRGKTLLIVTHGANTYEA